jgi:indolepyruvate ferredoxin oxidoreductase beta subunit
LIEKGEADIIIAFEKLEALRWIDYLKKGGTLVVNDQEIDPMPVITGKAKYPENIIAALIGNGIRIMSVDALRIAAECGNIKAVNIVLIGLMSKSTDIDRNVWFEAIKEVVPQKFLDVNIKAFSAGC